MKYRAAGTSSGHRPRLRAGHHDASDGGGRERAHASAALPPAPLRCRQVCEFPRRSTQLCRQFRCSTCNRKVHSPRSNRKTSRAVCPRASGVGALPTARWGRSSWTTMTTRSGAMTRRSSTRARDDTRLERARFAGRASTPGADLRVRATPDASVSLLVSPAVSPLTRPPLVPPGKSTRCAARRRRARLRRARDGGGATPQPVHRSDTGGPPPRPAARQRQLSPVWVAIADAAAPRDRGGHAPCRRPDAQKRRKERRGHGSGGSLAGPRPSRRFGPAPAAGAPARRRRRPLGLGPGFRGGGDARLRAPAGPKEAP